MSANHFHKVRNAIAPAVAALALLAAGQANAASDFGPVQIMQLGAIDFQLAETQGGVETDYFAGGGVRVSSGESWLNAGLRLPAGTKIKKIEVFLDPNGEETDVILHRYKPSDPNSKSVAAAVSTDGIVVEKVELQVNHVMKDLWNYRIDNIEVSPGGLILYGATVYYRMPK